MEEHFVQKLRSEVAICSFGVSLSITALYTLILALNKDERKVSWLDYAPDVFFTLGNNQCFGMRTKIDRAASTTYFAADGTYA